MNGDPINLGPLIVKIYSVDVEEVSFMSENDVIKNVIEYILTMNTGELAKLSVNKVAEKFGVNNCYLSRKFKNGTNFLLSEYINFARIQRAQNLLRTRNDMTVSQISQKIGFKKCQLFRIKFKKIYGINPNHYRILYKK